MIRRRCPRMPLTVGSRLGHYAVTALIGEGGMGKVYECLPETWVTDYSGDIGNTFGLNGFSMGSSRHRGLRAEHSQDEFSQKLGAA